MNQNILKPWNFKIKKKKKINLKKSKQKNLLNENHFFKK